MLSWLDIASAILSGLLIAAPYAWPAAWPLAFLGLTLLFAQAERLPDLRRAVIVGILFATAAMSGIFYWLNYTIVVYGDIHPIFSAIMFALYMTVFGSKYLVMVLGCFLLRRRAPLVSMALAVGTAEFLQFSLFPTYLGSTQVRNLYFMQAADVIGASGLTYVVALLAALLWGSLRGARMHVRPALALGGVLLAVYGYGVVRIHQIEELEAAAPAMRVALVQPDTPLRWQSDPAIPQRVIDTCATLTRAAARAAGGPLDLVVWPEGGTPFSFSRSYNAFDTYFHQTVEALARELHANMLFYDLLWDGKRPYNNVWLVNRDAQILGSYQKIMLLAFGEYIPGADVIPGLEGFGNVLQHRRGNSIHALRADAGVLAPQICYEILYPNFTRKFVRQGADVIVNVTNDAWFGPTTASVGHLVQALPRAIENRRPLIRCTNSGISTVEAADGRLLTPLTPLFQTAFRVAEIHSPRIDTFYSLYGDVFGWVCTLLTLGILLGPPLRARLGAR